MAKQTKQEKIIEQLKARRIEFDEKAKYADLVALLKAQPAEEPQPEGETEPQNDKLTDEQRGLAKQLHKDIGWPQNLLREALLAGFQKEQIVKFSSEEALYNAVARFRPQILSSAGKVTPPKPPKPPVEMEAKTETLTLSHSPLRAKTQLRAEDEERDIQAFLNRNGIRPNVTSIVITRNYLPNSVGKYETIVQINFRGPKK